MDYFKDVLQKYTEVTISIKLSDLMDCNRQLIKEVRDEFERQVSKTKQERLLSPDEAATYLKVTKTTLWRWAKQKYLTPVEVGGKRRYKMSDIKKLLDGEQK